MSKKITHEIVEASFNEAGYQLKSQYERNQDKLLFVCPNGHNHSISWSSWKTGVRCGKCPNPKRTPHEIVEASFKEAGYLLKSQYERCEDKLSFICPNGHNHSITWMDWRRGSRCGKCPVISSRKIPHEVVEASFNEAGYQLKSHYERCQDKLSFICPNGHNHSITWMDWRTGARCGKCAGWYKTQEEVESIFASEGYILLSEYKKSDTRLNYFCNKGHSSSITWESWKAGNRCDFCARNMRSFDYVRDSFIKDGYTLLTKHYEGCHQKLEFLCPEKHAHTT
ncbi:hypothetical protein [Pseudanabaena sp. 'Roaring Creek']|uniref:hypothetical protein n=1 Tax=Pseudanabaena sp. 'Roaring Creek' TaxID=1681830 RepID=UPI0006D7AB43|nr:hypothetical protein [Pseudanabaena sp. 'Roaring Creek']